VRKEGRKEGRKGRKEGRKEEKEGRKEGRNLVTSKLEQRCKGVEPWRS
jgi:hypothetical protein